MTDDEDYYKKIFEKTLAEKLSKLRPVQRILFTLDYDSWLIGFVDGLQEAKRIMEKNNEL